MNAVVNSQPEHPYYTKIGADGTVLPRSATEWEAVLDSRTGKMWDKNAISVKNGKLATVEGAAKKSRAAGFDDYRASTVEELFCLADRTKCGPAIDTEFFPDTPSDWFWSSTPDVEHPASGAWVVSFSVGNSGRYYHLNGGFVRAVRVGQ